MKGTLIVMSSNREMEPETRASLQVLRRAGAGFLLQAGVPDVAMARCQALSFACEALRGDAADRSVVLMLDDDMEVDLDAAQAVVTQARIRKCATAAAYATKMTTLAGTRWKDSPTPGRWLVGLGCVAIPSRLLLHLEKLSESFEIQGKVYSAFTWCGPEKGTWVAEDYRLSMRLGGVHLLPIAVGHVKKATLLPDDETLQRIANDEELTR
jgi:hypothetical protein